MYQGHKKILDAACGSKKFWFNKENKNVEFCDSSETSHREQRK